MLTKTNGWWNIALQWAVMIVAGIGIAILSVLVGNWDMNEISDTCAMLLEDLPTKPNDFVQANVGKYSSTMEHIGYIATL